MGGWVGGWVDGGGGGGLNELLYTRREKVEEKEAVRMSGWKLGGGWVGGWEDHIYIETNRWVVGWVGGRRLTSSTITVTVSSLVVGEVEERRGEEVSLGRRTQVPSSK